MSNEADIKSTKISLKYKTFWETVAEGFSSMLLQHCYVNCNFPLLMGIDCYN